MPETSRVRSRGRRGWSMRSVWLGSHLANGRGGASGRRRLQGWGPGGARGRKRVLAAFDSGSWGGETGWVELWGVATG